MLLVVLCAACDDALPDKHAATVISKEQAATIVMEIFQEDGSSGFSADFWSVIKLQNQVEGACWTYLAGSAERAISDGHTDGVAEGNMRYLRESLDGRVYYEFVYDPLPDSFGFYRCVFVDAMSGEFINGIMF